VRIGDSGSGTLDIEDGGTLTDGTGFIGYGAGSRGTVTVSGNDGSGNVSTWINTGDLVIGQSGIGTLAIEDGGTVTNTDGYIGATGGTIADPNNVTVSGLGSTWSNAGQLFVGDHGTATLDILDGGSVNSHLGLIGNNNGSNGTVTVSGFGSIWTNTTQINIGDEGTGTLRIENGGMVKSADGDLGGTTSSGATGNGTVIVSGTDGHGHASTWETSSNIYVGFAGTGAFTITDGGVVTTSAPGGGAATGYIGYTAGSVGTVTVSSSTGDVSRWTVTDDIIVGDDGTGTMNVEKGGRVHVDSDVIIASDSGGKWNAEPPRGHHRARHSRGRLGDQGRRRRNLQLRRRHPARDAG
jgi:T5SS/PEP-CTERM-associated repeat protein